MSKFLAKIKKGVNTLSATLSLRSGQMKKTYIWDLLTLCKTIGDIKETPHEYWYSTSVK